ncbi:uncharacterized protein LOC101710489 [Anopheles sinensis]|uniref:Uncharacterized protein LOC101710489 n=1 Tax=Anopheles sinensis TaxID=74873 RepID=A0A084WP48_ANOSI|nr:uncharacterized protein LOC101710489 [Anopheles sinensis]
MVALKSHNSTPSAGHFSRSGLSGARGLRNSSFTPVRMLAQHQDRQQDPPPPAYGASREFSNGRERCWSRQSRPSGIFRAESKDATVHQPQGDKLSSPRFARRLRQPVIGSAKINSLSHHEPISPHERTPGAPQLVTLAGGTEGNSRSVNVRE